MTPLEIVSCTAAERHTEFWRHVPPPSTWVCWLCHPSPLRPQSRLSDRQVGFWQYNRETQETTFRPLEWQRREPKVPSVRGRTVPAPDQRSGRRAADEAIQRVEANAPPDWMERALAAVERVATIRDEFTTDAIWHLVGAPPEPRAMGAVMRRAQQKGLAMPTDRTKESVRPECHARPVRVWRSLVP